MREAAYNLDVNRRKVVLETIRDIRRHDSVDGERIALAGFDQSALMCYDVALSRHRVVGPAQIRVGDDERVVAVAAVHSALEMRSAADGERVVALSAAEFVVARTAIYCVHGELSEQRVVTVATVDQIPTRAPLD